MAFKNRNRFRPIFKQLIKLQENVQNRRKLLKFKKKKWKSFLGFYKTKLKNFKKFKPIDHSKYFTTKYGTKSTSYSKRYKETLQSGKRLKLFYGNLLEKYFRKKIKKVLNKKCPNSKNLAESKVTFLQFFENRLDVVLYRAKFAPTVRCAHQLILRGKVYINNSQVKSKAYILQSGDLIKLHLSYLNSFENSIINSLKWPAPPKHLIINYRTLQIIFLGDVKSTTSIANEFSFNLRLQKILVNYFRL